MCLLDCLIRAATFYSISIYAVHIHHGIRGESADNDALFVERYCADNGIPFMLRKTDVPGIAKKRKKTVEEAGREERYRLLCESMVELSANRIAVAHNRNDNAETVIMRIGRGTGIDGLSGIQPVRGRIIRPLIETGREEITGYLSERSIPYRRDETNETDRYLRNRIRLSVIPEMERAMGKSVVDNILRLSALSTEDCAILNGSANEAYDRCLIFSDGFRAEFSVPLLAEYPPAIQKRIVRKAISIAMNDSNADFSYRNMEQVLDILNGQTGRQASLHSGVTVRKDYRSLIIDFAFSGEEIKNTAYPLDMNGEVYVREANLYVAMSDKPDFAQRSFDKTCTKKIICDRIFNAVLIRTRRPGDIISVKGVGTQKLSDYFINRKYPREKRDGIFLVADGSRILLILDERGLADGAFRAESPENANAVYFHFWPWRRR